MDGKAGEKTKIYLDFVFLQDFLIDYLLLLPVKRLLHKKTGGLRLMAGAAVGGLCSTAVYLFLPAAKGLGGMYGAAMALCRIAAACIMLLTALYPLNKKDFFAALLLLYGAAFLAEGVLRWLRGYIRSFPGNRYSLWMLLGAGVFFYGFASRLAGLLRERLSLRQALCKVQICVGGRCAEGMGFLDSGNNLTEPITGRPVVVVEASFLEEKCLIPPDKGFFMIPFHALGCENGMLKGFLADRLIVENGEERRCYEKVMLGIYEGKLGRGDAYQMLLHPCL